MVAVPARVHSLTTTIQLSYTSKMLFDKMLFITKCIYSTLEWMFDIKHSSFSIRYTLHLILHGIIDNIITRSLWSFNKFSL